jgi:hypothetical protein
VVNLMLFKVDVLIHIPVPQLQDSGEHDKFYHSPIKLVLSFICMFFSFVFPILLNSIPGPVTETPYCS